MLCVLWKEKKIQNICKFYVIKEYICVIEVIGNIFVKCDITLYI